MIFRRRNSPDPTILTLIFITVFLIASFLLIPNARADDLYEYFYNGSNDSNGSGGDGGAMGDMGEDGNDTIFDGITCPGSMAGDGTQANPCIITTCIQLQQANQSLGANYSLGNNIDCSATLTWNCQDGLGCSGFNPIGSSAYFTGSFEGGGYNITNLSSNRSNEAAVSLLGYIQNTNVSNLNLINTSITASTQAAGIIGYSINSKVVNSSVIDGYIQSAGTAGGIVGHVGGGTYMNVTGCKINTTIVSSSNNVGGVGGSFWGYVKDTYVNSYIEGNRYVGGIAGTFKSNSWIEDSYVAGNVTGYRYVGGLIGLYENSNSRANDSFSAASVSSTGGQVYGLVGGDSGSLSMDNVYYYNKTGNPTNCRPSGDSGCVKEDTLSYYYLQASQPMTIWDFIISWGFFDNDDGTSHPCLRWENNCYWQSKCPGTMRGMGTFDNPCNISTCEELQNMSQNLSSYYRLVNNIDCSNTSVPGASVWDATGFVPVGTFTGTLNGSNYNISNLYISRSSNSQGLFSIMSGTVTDLNITNAYVRGDSWNVGILSADCRGTVSRVFVSGSVRGDLSGTNGQIGGLTGYSTGCVINQTITDV
jgi:hypothetical protein